MKRFYLEHHKYLKKLEKRKNAAVFVNESFILENHKIFFL